MAGIVENKSQLKRRIAMITQFKKNSYQWSPLAIVLIVILSCISLPDAERTRASETAAPGPATPITLRQVWSGPDADAYGGPSPDGRYLSHTDWKNGDLAIRELATGETRRLTETKKGGQEKSFRFALNSVISPDGKLIAYSWTNKYGTYDLCVIGIDGSGDRILCSGKDYELYPACWSSDGKRIAARRYTSKSGYLEIVSVSVADGSVQVLKSSERVFWPRFCYSPDNRFIACDFPVAEDAKNFNISLIRADGGGEIPLITHPANDRLLGWVPNRDEVLFRSDRSGTHDIWAVRVVEGKVQGSPRPVTRDVGEISPRGFTRNGSFYFSRHKRRFTSQTMPFDAQTGEVQEQLAKPLLGSNFSPIWSPDDKHLVYVEEQTTTAGPGWHHRPVHVRNVKTGEDRTFAERFTVRGPRWSPDGRSILVIGMQRKEPRQEDYNGGIYRIDVQDGEVTELVRFPPVEKWSRDIWSRSVAEWAHDGQAIFYTSRGRIIRRQVESGQEKQLYQSENLSRALDVSPDGKTLIFGNGLPGEGGGQAMAIPVSGGQPTELCRFQERKGGLRTPRQLVWTPDGKYVLFAKSEEKGSTVWRVSCDGGEPERIWVSRDRVTDLSVNSNGKEIAFSTFLQETPVWVLENFLPEAPVVKRTAEPTFTKIQISTKPQNGVLSPDGNKLAFMSDDAVWVLPLHGKLDPDIAGEPVRLAEVTGIWERSNMMTWSADGKWIAVYGGSQSDSDEGSVVSILPVAGGKPRVVQLPKQGGHLWSYRLSLSPDGQFLACQAREPDSHARYIYTIPTAGGKPKKVSSRGGSLPAFSPDGKFIAYVGHTVREDWQETKRNRFGGELWIVPSEGGTPVKVATVDGRLRGPVWSPDGRYIAAHHEPGGNNDSKEIWVFQLSPDASSAGEPEKIALPRSSWNMLAGWTPDNELGVFIQTEEHCAIYTVPASGGKAVQISPAGAWPYYPRWSPDGERIYCRGMFGQEEEKATLLYVPATGGDPVKVPVRSERHLVSIVPGGGLNVSPDGKRIVVSAYQEPHKRKESVDLWTITLDGGLPTRLTNDDSHEAYPCWSPDGEWVAFVEWHAKSEGEGFNAIYIAPAEGGQIRQVSTESDSVGGGAIAFSPDGERIAFFSGGSIKTIPVEGGESKILVAEVKSRRHSQLAYSPDGEKIAHSAADKIWIASLDGAEPQELSTGLPSDTRLSEFSWSPDGEKIAFFGSIGGEAELWLIEDFLPEDFGK
jgi:Tol biopolymer transport system component